jgi:hypothetical protein
MIYIIEDKIQRQYTFAPWLEKNEVHKYKIITITNRKEFENFKDDIKKSAKLIGFHDSFFNDSTNSHEQFDPKEIKEHLINYCVKHGIHIVTFSGGGYKTNIDKKGFSHTIPDDIFYSNLLAFLNNLPQIEPLILGYGKNFKYEEVLRTREALMHRLFLVPNDSLISIENRTLNNSIVTEFENIVGLCSPEEKEMLVAQLKAGTLTKHQLISKVNESIKV